MPRTRLHSLAAGGALLAAAALASTLAFMLATAKDERPGGGTLPVTTRSGPAKQHYWTKQRMRRARPINSERWLPADISRANVGSGARRPKPKGAEPLLPGAHRTKPPPAYARHPPNRPRPFLEFRGTGMSDVMSRTSPGRHAERRNGWRPRRIARAPFTFYERR